MPTVAVAIHELLATRLVEDVEEGEVPELEYPPVPQLARRTEPFIERDDDDSTINYE